MESKLKKVLKFNIKGMHCASCSALIEISLKNKKGIENVSVNLLTNSASMSIDNIEIDPSDVIPIIENLGYKAALAEEGEKKKP
jgi:copper chaperone CopZ